MYKYIETHNTHIMYAHNCYCIHSCTLIDYHNYLAQSSTFLQRGRIYYNSRFDAGFYFISLVYYYNV